MAACNGTLSEPSKLLVQLYTERLAAADEQIDRLIEFMNDELEKADLIKSVMFLQTVPGINIDIARTIVSVVGGGDSLLRGLLHIRPDSGEFEASRGVGFLRMYESPPIKKHLNQGWYGLLLRGGPVRHLGDAAGVNLDRCGGRP